LELQSGDQISQNEKKILSLESIKATAVNQPYTTMEVGHIRSETGNSSADDALEIEESTEVDSDQKDESLFGSELSSVNSDDDF
jgi:hypothetical protein